MLQDKQREIFEQISALPSLRQGWVRVVHRCLSNQSSIQNIKLNGLIFNRDAAKLSPLQRGGSYNHITSMASVYDEKGFWQSMMRDDFYCYDNSRYADTKIVFDMPQEEFCFLQNFGRFVKGKIDAKYLVGVVPNINGENPNLRLPPEDVLKAKHISQNSAPSTAEPNDVDVMIEDFLNRYPKTNVARKASLIKNMMEQTKEELSEKMSQPQNNSHPISKDIFSSRSER